MRDRAYHAANPGATACVAGKVGATETIKTVLGFHFPNLKDPGLAFLAIGEIDINATVFLTARDQDLTGIRAFEFPLDSEIWWRILPTFPRSISLNNVAIFQIAAGVKA